MTQLTLPMETEILIPNNDIAHAVNQIVETILETEFYEFNHYEELIQTEILPKLLLYC
ncbi:hypothetical protein NF736_08750 [Staphylococcus equorum]|nr:MULTISPECIES: hypothetical protein [Staphylococcus]MCE5007752.1 hypothetical protein [Staphylococcus equorum]MDK9852125.1 hypothetical protein [Staphylococcus equorum]MDK9854904.1 hypothetical protein [Staphylococcus equorum]MEB7672273.1 hypothetical protein [Staphylococcus equorum]MEB7745645.1 hypothetical protein [Staphylococcus equorum]